MAIINQKYSFIWYGFCPNSEGISSSCSDLTLDSSLGIKTVWQINGSAVAKAWVSDSSASQSFTSLKCGSIYYIEKLDSQAQIQIDEAFVSPYDSGSKNRISDSCLSPVLTPTSTTTSTSTTTPSSTSTLTPTLFDSFSVSANPDRINITSINGSHSVSGDNEMKFTFTKENIETVFIHTDDTDSASWEYYNGSAWVNLPFDNTFNVSSLSVVKFRLKPNQVAGSYDCDITIVADSLTADRQLRATVQDLTPTPTSTFTSTSTTTETPTATPQDMEFRWQELTTPEGETRQFLQVKNFLKPTNSSWDDNVPIDKDWHTVYAFISNAERKIDDDATPRLAVQTGASIGSIDDLVFITTSETASSNTYTAVDISSLGNNAEFLADNPYDFTSGNAPLQVALTNFNPDRAKNRTNSLQSIVKKVPVETPTSTLTSTSTSTTTETPDVPTPTSTLTSTSTSTTTETPDVPTPTSTLTTTSTSTTTETPDVPTPTSTLTTTSTSTTTETPDVPTPTSTLTTTSTSTTTETPDVPTPTLTHTSTSTLTPTPDAGGTNPSALGYIIAQVIHNGTDSLAGSLFDDNELNLDTLDKTVGNNNTEIISGRNLKYAGQDAASLADYITKFTDFASSSTEIGSNDPLSCDSTFSGFGTTTSIGGNKVSPCVIATIPLANFSADGSFSSITFDQGPLTNQSECAALNSFCPAASSAFKKISNISDDFAGVLYSIWLPIDQVSNKDYTFKFKNSGFSGGEITRDADGVLHAKQVSFNGTIYRCFSSDVSLTSTSSSADSNGWSINNGQLDNTNKVITFSSTAK